MAQGRYKVNNEEPIIGNQYQLLEKRVFDTGVSEFIVNIPETWYTDPQDEILDMYITGSVSGDPTGLCMLCNEETDKTKNFSMSLNDGRSGVCSLEGNSRVGVVGGNTWNIYLEIHLRPLLRAKTESFCGWTNAGNYKRWMVGHYYRQEANTVTKLRFVTENANSKMTNLQYKIFRRPSLPSV